MDITRPQLTWVDGKCYRVNDVVGAVAVDTSKQGQPSNEYVEPDLYRSDDEECENENDADVVELRPGKFEAIFHVPNSCFGAIIGKKGATLQRIQNETKTVIKVPKSKTDNQITVLGLSRSDVLLARRRIDAIVTGIRHKSRPTHFTCVKITNTDILERCTKFKNEVMEMSSDIQLVDEMFIQPSKLHLTINVMHLMDDADRATAKRLLNECKTQIIAPIIAEHGQVTFQLRGLEIMNKVESDVLQLIADAVYRYFIKSNIAKQEFQRDCVKLHMTLINTKYSILDDDGERHDSPRRKIDVRLILEQFGDIDFGSDQANEIHLAIILANGFYKCSTSIRF